jgi:hypothetical protein
VKKELNGVKSLKKFICIAIFLIVLIVLLPACSSKKQYSNSLKSTIHSNDKSPEITVESPMTISNNDMFPISGKHQYIRLRMVNGRYYEDWTPGPYMGMLWEGEYTIELVDEFGKVLAETKLNNTDKEPLIFNTQFKIEFGDYNNDGNFDFTIGQYASSNGREYKLFTITRDNKIEEIPIKGHSSLFISNTTGFYSTKLTKVNNNTFKIVYYDNSKGKYFEDFFKWIDKKFIHTKTQESKKSM